MSSVARRGHSFPARSRVQITSLNSPDENPMRRFRSGFYFASHPPISTHCASYSISSRFDAQRLCTSAHRPSHRRGCGPPHGPGRQVRRKMLQIPRITRVSQAGHFPRVSREENGISGGLQTTQSLPPRKRGLPSFVNSLLGGGGGEATHVLGQ